MAFGLIGIIAVGFILFPIIALAVRVPWARMGEILARPEVHDLLKVSLAAAAQSTVLTMILGTGLAVWMQQLGRGGLATRLLVFLPLAMPPVVGGLALTAAIGRRGLLGPWLEAIDLHFAFAFPGVVVAQMFVSLPFVVVAVDSALRQIDGEVLASAHGIGMSPGRVLWKVTLPLVAPSIATGAGLAFARSLGEFGTTLTFAGSMPGVTRTMPLGIYLEREVDTEAAYALAAILIGLALVCLALAGLPVLLGRKPRPHARTITEMDVERLRELTRPPEDPTPVTVEGTTLPAGRVSAIVGQNGSGKTTLMRRAAGQLRGQVAIGDRTVDDAAGQFVPPHQRRVVMVTQSPGLPPRASVVEAVTMASRDHALATQLLEAAGLSDLADVDVPSLSGGQAAQVALVRALATRPSVLILDEPLAALDVAAAARWRRFFHASRHDHTVLMVTHNLLDIQRLAEHLVVMESGQTVASGPTSQLLAAPPTEFVARVSGLNRATGTCEVVHADTARVAAGGATLIGATTAHLRPQQEVVVTFPPEDARLSAHPVARAENCWPGTVQAVEARSLTTFLVTLDCPFGQVRVSHAEAPAVGEEVYCQVDPQAVHISPNEY
ncbi:Sulfate transport system permease protein CysW [Corynebacterium confusum]|nr:Sulfate transport system permease protein CysW [Corynebacterium confusum]